MATSAGFPISNVIHGLSSFPSSPAGSNFVPRKEFAPEPPHQASSFALLAFSANNVIRLSNFHLSLVKDLRERLDLIIGIHSFRENAEQKLCEIVLMGKPWSSAKALSTEILVVQVFVTIFAHRYSFLSHLHYGKEHNDRVTLAFSTPAAVNNSAPLIPPLIPFALSFTSSTSLQVVCSPLRETPAILQSVRNAWPRGVTSEKKLGEHCYQFKLKGYSWFQEDHFAEDALTFMLILLASLDKHGWSFTTSISLSSNHSRNRDLWIFVGHGSFTPDSTVTRPLTPINLGSPLKPSVHEAIFDNRKTSEESQPSDSGHIRSATESQVVLGRSRSPSEDNLKSGHVRSTSDSARFVGRKSPINPLAAGQRIRHSPEGRILSPVKLVSPSEITAGDVSPQTPRSQPPRHSLVSLPEEVERNHGERDDSQSQPYSEGDVKDNTVLVTSNVEAFTPPITQEVTTPLLLGPTAFRPRSGSEGRNSAFSDVTGRSFDIPVAWIPDGQQFVQDKEEDYTDFSRRLSLSEFPQGVTDPQLSLASTRIETMGPLPPGAWMNTPLVEREDPVSSQRTSPAPRKETPPLEPRQSIIVCHSPQVVNPDLPDPVYVPRPKSETGEVGVMPAMSPAADRSTGASPLGGQTIISGDLREQVHGGWVLINVHPSSSSSPMPQSDSSTSTEMMTSPKIKKTSPTPGGTLVQQTGPSSDPAVPAQALEVVGQREGIPRMELPRETLAPQRPEKSIMGRLLSRKMGSRRVKPIHENALSDREKDSRLKKTGGILPTIRSNKRLNID